MEITVVAGMFSMISVSILFSFSEFMRHKTFDKYNHLTLT